MLGHMITLTTSIATTAAIGVARAGAAAVTGGAGRSAPVQTRTVVRDSRSSIATLIRALEAERSRSAILEAENARLRETIEIAEDLIDELQQPAG